MARPRVLRSPATLLEPQFYDIYHNEAIYVWTFLRRLGVTQRDLEDLTQEVFTKFFERLHQFDRERPVRPWLLGIAYRVALDFWRLSKHQLEVVTDPTLLARRAAADPSEEAAIHRRDLVAVALSRLPLPRRVDARPQRGESVRHRGGTLAAHQHGLF